MWRYKLGSLTLESNLQLPELGVTTAERSDYRFDISPEPAPWVGQVRWVQHWQLEEGPPTLSVGRTDTGYLLHFPGKADFIVSDDEPALIQGFVSDIPPQTIRHLLLDQVIPLLLARRGEFVIHASAVLLPGGAVGFAGASGQGKSTLTASLVQQGFPLLTDDCLLLEEREGGWLVTATYPGLRLWDDVREPLFGAESASSEVAHYTSKKRVDAKINFCDGPVELRRLYLLAEESTAADGVAIAHLPQHERLLRILNHVFRLDPTDQSRLRSEFDVLARVAASPLIRELRYPRRLELLPDVRRAILEDVDSDGPGIVPKVLCGTDKLA